MYNNNFYHKFSVGFNYWMVFMPAVAVLFIILGVLALKIRKDGRTIVSGESERVVKAVDYFMVAVSIVMLFIESDRGILQFFDNTFGGGNDPYGVCTAFLSLVTYPVVGFLLYCGYYLMFSFGTSLKKILRKNYIMGRRNIARQKLYCREQYEDGLSFKGNELYEDELFLRDNTMQQQEDVVPLDNTLRAYGEDLSHNK